MKSPFLYILLLTLLSACSTEQPTPDRPANVIVIFMDDMGYGDLSSYGHPTIQTPNIDRLAREGQQWTNFYTASSVCSPARGALLTGRYPIRIGLAGDNQRVFFPESIGGLPTEEVTIAEMLKDHGYKTGIIGKWHLGHLPEYLPTKQGFDSYYGIPYSNDMDAVKWGFEAFFSEPDINMWNVPLMKNDSIIERPADQFTITKRYTEKAIEFITENKDDPFFLYMPHSMVHTPLFASEGFQGTSARGLYGDVMNEIDWSVGQVVATLEKLNLDKNTLVVFTSDNGPWLLMQHQGGSAGLLKDGKGTTWEGGQRVPGIFYMPGTVKPGIITGLGSTLDFLPTIASLTGAKTPNVLLDGYDLMPVLTDHADSPRKEFFYYRKKELYAARKGDYKTHYITETAYALETGRIDHETPLLYQLNIDPSEKYNRAEKLPQKIEEMNKMVAEHKKTVVMKAMEMDRYPEDN